MKNLPDGTVEIVAVSSPAVLDDFLGIAHAKDDPVIHVEEIADSYLISDPANLTLYDFVAID